MCGFVVNVRYSRRDREASALERRVEGLEAQVADLTAKLNEAEAPRKRLEKENSVRLHALLVGVVSVTIIYTWNTHKSLANNDIKISDQANSTSYLS